MVSEKRASFVTEFLIKNGFLFVFLTNSTTKARLHENWKKKIVIKNLQVGESFIV